YSTILVHRQSTTQKNISLPQTYPHPYITRGPGPTRQSSVLQNNQEKDQKNQPCHTMAPTFDIPFGSNKTSAKRTSPAAERSAMGTSILRLVPLTLSHEIFKVMPFDIISQVSDIDPAFLLGRFAHRLHHLFFGCSTIFERSWWSAAPSSGVA